MTDLLFVVVCGYVLVALCRSQMTHGADNGSTRSRRNIDCKITAHGFKNIYFLWTWRYIKTNVKFPLLAPFRRIMVPKTINILLFIIGKKYITVRLGQLVNIIFQIVLGWSFQNNYDV